MVTSAVTVASSNSVVRRVKLKTHWPGVGRLTVPVACEGVSGSTGTSIGCTPADGRAAVTFHSLTVKGAPSGVYAYRCTSLLPTLSGSMSSWSWYSFELSVVAKMSWDTPPFWDAATLTAGVERTSTEVSPRIRTAPRT